MLLNEYKCERCGLDLSLIKKHLGRDAILYHEQLCLQRYIQEQINSLIDASEEYEKIARAMGWSVEANCPPWTFMRMALNNMGWNVDHQCRNPRCRTRTLRVNDNFCPECRKEWNRREQTKQDEKEE